MNGELIVRVFAGTIGQPLKNAQVTVQGGTNNVDHNLVTDDIGETSPVVLQAPNLSASTTEGSTEIGYGSYNIIVTKPEFTMSEIINARVYPGVTSYQDVFLYPLEEGISSGNVIILPDFYVGIYPPKIPEPEETGDVTGSESLEPNVLPTTVIPEYITVHDGTIYQTAAANYTIPFADYIKNVTMSEIGATWPEEAIKANVLAITSFALNRIYTEWYRNQNYNYDITGYTSQDQKYTPGLTIAANVSRIVDELFGQYIAVGNNTYPLLAQYTDGKVVPQRPNQMTQWGSYSLANQGYSALQILRYFYGSNINIRYADQVSGSPSSYPGYPLTLGSCGVDVQIIQNQLNVIKTAYSLIPRITNPNGEYDSETANSVKVFQSIFNLPQTGVVDYATWYKISRYYTSISGIAKGVVNN